MNTVKNVKSHLESHLESKRCNKKTNKNPQNPKNKQANLFNYNKQLALSSLPTNDNFGNFCNIVHLRMTSEFQSIHSTSRCSQENILNRNVILIHKTQDHFLLW